MASVAADYPTATIGEPTRDPGGVYVNQRFLGKPVTLLFLGNPGGQRLLHDPPAQPLAWQKMI